MAQGFVVHDRPVSELGLDARATFISKTYSHLLGGIIIFTLLLTVLFHFGIAERIARPMLNNWLLVLGGFMLLGMLGTGIAQRARSPAAQYAGFGFYILIEALIFCPLLYIAAGAFDGVITKAAVATLVGFSGLTAIAFTTRKDFSFMGGILRWCGLCALGLIVASLVFGFSLGVLFSVAMVALAGGFILYETSNVLHHYPENKHVGAALALFASVALMFWYMVRIFMSFDE